MKIEKGEELLKPFLDKAEEDEDAYCLVHFSRIEDKFNGVHGNMDFADALIVIKHLIKQFNIPVHAVSLVNVNN